VADWTEDKVLNELEAFDATVVKTSLSDEDEAKLKEYFGPHGE
jgi:uncharacterized membrane protein